MGKIIGLWAHPRSMSTAIERIMRERGDLKCFHEPFMYDYYVHRNVRTMPHFSAVENHPVSYQDIKHMLLQAAKQTDVFFKDMSYYVHQQVVIDADFKDKLINCFVIRDPMASIVSYSKLDADFTLEETGLEAQWQHFFALQKTTGATPAVVNASDVRQNPTLIIGKLFDHIGLPHNTNAYQWTSDIPQDWQQVNGWHGKAISTNAIQPLSIKEQQQIQESFEKLCATNPLMRDYYDYHLPFYELLNYQALK